MDSMIMLLILRLERGWTICAAATDPNERDRLETFWIALLRTYEQACDARIGDVGSPAAEAV